MDEFGFITLTNPAGRIFDLQENAGAVTIQPQGSELVVSYLLTQSSSYVRALPLFAIAATGSFTISDAVTSASSNSWLTNTTTSNQGVQFRVTQLTPNTSYLIFRNNVLVSTMNSDAVGELSFSDVLPVGGYRYQVNQSAS